MQKRQIIGLAAIFLHIFNFTALPNYKNMHKRWKFRTHQQSEVDNLFNQLNINPVFCELLAQRGIKTFEAAHRFFRPKLEYLHDPYLMKDMEKAVQRIDAAKRANEKIVIYGDYDVDGTSSVALLLNFLGKYCKQLDYYIPDRINEGYGVSKKGIEYAKTLGATLFITVDCGIRDFKSLALARESGMDVIICDHHLPDSLLPFATAILNPKQANCPYPEKELSACAVAFKLVQALAKHWAADFETEVAPLLDLVMLSLACDMVPLLGENRILSHFGLERFNEHPRPGLAVLREQTQRRAPFSLRDIVFGVGPVLNAGGRMGHARETLQLLTATNKEAAAPQAAQLMLRNQERKASEAQMLEEAIATIEDDPTFHDKRCTIVRKAHWHNGLLGIVASKLVEKYNRPTIVFTEGEDGRLVGSARSVGEFDIHNALGQCSEQLSFDFGGHKYAAGLNIEEENYEDFCDAFEQVLYHTLSTDDMLPTLFIDAQLDIKTINDKFWNILKQFGPFGPGNQQPVFLSKLVRDTGYSKLVKDDHIKLLVRQGDSDPIEGIAYGFGYLFEELSSRKPFHVCYCVEEQHFMGKAKLQVIVQDMKF